MAVSGRRRKQNKSINKHVSKATTLNNDDSTKTPSTHTRFYYWTLAMVMILMGLITVTVINRYSSSTDVRPHITKPHPRPHPPQSHIDNAHRLTYQGDLEALKQLMSGNTYNWSGIQWTDGNGNTVESSSTLLHLALKGRQDSISSSSTSLIGDHEGILSYLISEHHWNISHGCPVYFALHYKNMKALKIFLTTSAVPDSTMIMESLHCLTVMDSVGLTALHVASKSKASGFARFYSKLLDSNGFIHRPPPASITSLLGLSHKVPHQPYPRVLSMEALYGIVLHKDMTLILELLLYQTNTKLSQVLDEYGNTLIHMAAYSGRLELVKTLLKYARNTNDEADVRNVFKQTPRQLAEAAGYSNIARLFNDEPLKNETRKMAAIERTLVSESQQMNWNEYLKSGWNIRERSLLSWNDSLCSNVLPVVQNLSPEVMSYHEPLLVYANESKQWSAWKHWRKRDIIERYGQLVFEVSKMPYEDIYFTSNDRMTKITLNEYIKSFSSTGKHPLYLFDGKVLDRLPQLASDFIIPSWLRPSSIYLKQFILGGHGSGSPPHFHDHAVNALIYGVKEWYFWRPNESYFTFTHVTDWKTNNYDRHSKPYIRCVQLPGDVVYVPQDWGHAVVNMEDSVGIALEFW